jgi:hypothetical protein
MIHRRIELRTDKSDSFRPVKFMKISKAKLAATPATPVLPQTMHRVRSRGAAEVPTPKAEKRDNTFSKSRDTREDRGARQMKTSHNPQTFSH